MLLYVHCVAYLCAGVILGWNPELSPKFQHILATQETLTDFHAANISVPSVYRKVLVKSTFKDFHTFFEEEV